MRSKTGLKLLQRGGCRLAQFFKSTLLSGHRLLSK